MDLTAAHHTSRSLHTPLTGSPVWRPEIPVPGYGEPVREVLRIPLRPRPRRREVRSSGRNKVPRSGSIPENKRPAPKRKSALPGESSSLAKAGSNVLSKAAPRFKRHNHEKYTEKIRNKAKDKVNKERTCTYATLCRDSTTDEWSLWIYRSEAKTYRFVAYSWDEVDEKWEKSFESDKLPLSGLKHHLEFTAAGKDCQILKGRKR